MLTVGVTGSFGSGKSTVAAMFRRRGALVIDADAIVHRLLAGHAGCRRKVVAAFGRGVFAEGRIDRKKLAGVVFSDPRALRQLEKILHPLAWRETEKALRRAKERLVVVDAPLLIEAGWHKKVDAVLVVRTRSSLQVDRVKTRTGLSRAEVVRRIGRQLPIRTKLKYADFVVDNSGTKNDTNRQVGIIWKNLLGKTNQQE
ncbi:MAG: dephospho-CoA kinase [Candidatus Omnitrophica bacterium]|nr:dephospho-CoA kinase [Candidatus Omnitrophota bacterium]